MTTTITDSRGLFPPSDHGAEHLPRASGWGPCEHCGHQVPPLGEPVPRYEYPRVPYYRCPVSQDESCRERHAAQQAMDHARDEAGTAREAELAAEAASSSLANAEDTPETGAEAGDPGDGEAAEHAQEPAETPSEAEAPTSTSAPPAGRTRPSRTRKAAPKQGGGEEGSGE